MLNLSNKVILYDDVCPLCKAYTSGFVHLGWLLPAHRIGFSQAPEHMLQQIDIDRARHEIPLFDIQSGETLYGKEALFYILGSAYPTLKPLFSWRPFRAVIVVLYKIITYNRRIIAASPKPPQGFDCAPDFNAFYRWLYIGISICMAILILAIQWRGVEHATLYPSFGLIIAGILRGLFFKTRIETTTYYGHFTTVLCIMSISLVILGWNNVTAAVLPLAAVYLWTKRRSIEC